MLDDQIENAEQAGAMTTVSLLDARGRRRRLFDIEMDVIQAALKANKGDVTETAAQLGIGRSTLYRRLSGTL